MSKTVYISLAIAVIGGIIVELVKHYFIGGNKVTQVFNTRPTVTKIDTIVITYRATSMDSNKVQLRALIDSTQGNVQISNADGHNSGENEEKQPSQPPITINKPNTKNYTGNGLVSTNSDIWAGYEKNWKRASNTDIWAGYKKKLNRVKRSDSWDGYRQSPHF